MIVADHGNLHEGRRTGTASLGTACGLNGIARDVDYLLTGTLIVHRPSSC